MARVCMRPGCDRLAQARLSYDTVTCQVWLDQVLERPGSTQEICEMHAERLTVPRGWMLCDRREDEPALFVAAVVQPEAAVVKSSRRRARRHPTEQPRNLFDDPVAARSEPVLADVIEIDPEPVPEPEPDTAPADEVPAPPDPDRAAPDPAGPEPAAARRAGRRVADDPEVPDTLQASSPLLARAFRQTGPQRSVLTQPSAEGDRDERDPT